MALLATGVQAQRAINIKGGGTLMVDTKRIITVKDYGPESFYVTNIGVVDHPKMPNMVFNLGVFGCADREGHVMVTGMPNTNTDVEPKSYPWVAGTVSLYSLAASAICAEKGWK